MFCLDYGDFRRLRLPEHLFVKDNCRIVTIDHHLESDQRGEIRVLESEASSTAELIYHWLKYAGIEINQDLATLLLTGIFSDSGGLKEVAVPAQNQLKFSLTDEEILKLADWALIIEKHYGIAEDIEWAKDGKTNELFIVQSRPETIYAPKDVNIYKEYEIKTEKEPILKGSANTSCANVLCVN